MYIGIIFIWVLGIVLTLISNRNGTIGDKIIYLWGNRFTTFALVFVTIDDYMKAQYVWAAILTLLTIHGIYIDATMTPNVKSLIQDEINKQK
jgi:hypothetical protein